MDGIVGKINCFIVEPFVPHAEEYYLCIQASRVCPPWVCEPAKEKGRWPPSTCEAQGLACLPACLPRCQSDVQSERLGYTISFSEFGGMDIEENWEKVPQDPMACGP
jgi:hypothetical protein